MNWFRSNLRLGSRLALVALAIQFALSFGHFHAADRPIVSAPTEPAVQVEAVQVEAGHVEAGHVELSAFATRPATPSHHEPAGQASDDCAICAVMALAHAMVVATPPDLPVPPDARLLAASGTAAFFGVTPAAVAFQPRAPPAA